MGINLSTQPEAAFSFILVLQSLHPTRFLALALTLLIIQYGIRYALFLFILQQPKINKAPPTLPHLIPVLGHTLSYWWNPSNFTNHIVPFAAGGSPVRVHILGKVICVVTGRDRISTLWRYSSLSSSTILYRFALGQVFGMSKKAANRVLDDDSGFLAVPHPESNVAPHNRVHHYVHESLERFLSGPGLEPFVRRFETNIVKEVDLLEVGQDWVNMTDFFDFITSLVTPATVKALCGPYLLEQNPHFCRNFWDYINGLGPIAKGMPRLLFPRPYAIRDALVRDLESWHSYAREHFDPSKIDIENDIDPFWGCRMMRERQDIFHRMDDFDNSAVAAGDLGALIGVASNPIIGSFWSCYEIFRNPQVLSRARDEAASSVFPTSNFQAQTRFLDIPRLISQAMLQSVFAETLRLRMTFFITRYTKREEIKFGNWRLPKNEAIFVPTSVAHLDTNAWNQGRDGEYPLDEFWAYRFLVYQNDPYSGPKKKYHNTVTVGNATIRGRIGTQTFARRDIQLGEPKFSMQNMYSSWIPFGGGAHTCPGRFFSKRQMMMVMALMVLNFDIEFLDQCKVGVSQEDFGIGVQRPDRQVPFRIRRR